MHARRRRTGWTGKSTVTCLAGSGGATGRAGNGGAKGPVSSGGRMGLCVRCLGTWPV
ncbi:hypothetical protein GCM10010272_65990 [Streptomyces lateritius]|nr:hypothetical protein GCM10010272_65990 [Streptomyces lateritius]